jgi:hypothetical protein
LRTSASRSFLIYKRTGDSGDITTPRHVSAAPRAKVRRAADTQPAREAASDRGLSPGPDDRAERRSRSGEPPTAAPPSSVVRNLVKLDAHTIPVRDLSARAGPGRLIRADGVAPAVD